MLKTTVRFIFLQLICLSIPALAQGDSTRVLIPDQTLSGVIDAENTAQVYTFTATEGSAVAITLTPQAEAALTMIVTDVDGNRINQAVGTGTETNTGTIPIEETSTYFVTVFPSAGTQTTASTFDIVLTLEAGETGVGSAPQPSTFQVEQVILPNGLEVTLNWDTTDDLNLQVRDPLGGTLFWDSRATDEGGVFGLDANGLCEVQTEEAAETASWPGGAVPTGSYEILVFYRQACIGNEPVDFTVNVLVDGVELDPIEGTLLPPVNNTSNVFLSSFVLNPDGITTIGTGGLEPDIRSLDVPIADLMAAGTTPIAKDIAQTGVITSDNPYEVYTYEGLAGEIISAELLGTSGNLDTLLLVIDSAGNVIASNDDRVSVVDTNAAIESLRLPADDTYSIVATRYGKSVGGTQGEYALLVSGSNIPDELLALELPSGDIEVTLTWNTGADLQLLVRDPSGSSIYDDVPAVPSGGRLTAQGNINCTVTESEATPVSYIYWPDGFLRIGSYEVEVWYQSDCGDTQPVFFTIYVVVENELIYTETTSIEFGEKYLMNFNVDQSGRAIPGAGGIIGDSSTLPWQSETASAVQITPGQTFSGSITDDDTFDVYTFEGRAGDLVTIDLRATSNTLDTLLFLIDPDGVEIASNDDSNETTNSLISNELLSQDGDYTILATHYGANFGGTTGSYNLSLRIDR